MVDLNASYKKRSLVTHGCIKTASGYVHMLAEQLKRCRLITFTPKELCSGIFSLADIEFKMSSHGVYFNIQIDYF
jgi:hypothetical protein